MPASEKNIHLILQIFFIFLRLGCTSFGGPIAHLGYFHTEFVEKRKWFTENAYADLVGLCQFLPGPASSQVGIAIGLTRAGYSGALAAWLGFTLPSAFVLIAFAYGVAYINGVWATATLHGLKVVAVAVVAQAIWQMGTKLCPDKIRATIAVMAVLSLSIIPASLGQIMVILGGGILGTLLLKPSMPQLPQTIMTNKVSWKVGSFALALFFSLLMLLPIVAASSHNQVILLIDHFYRAGALVFGGGHVVLPLLQSAVVESGWITNDRFLAGYAAAQAVPGPLFTFAAYLGAITTLKPNGILGGIICLVAIFLPAFLLMIGVLPFWEKLKQFTWVQKAMLGVNAAVVGILLYAFYHFIWNSTVQRPLDFVHVLLTSLLLMFWKLPAWMVVVLSVLIGIVFSYI